jgi:hypothetical protein
MVPSVASESPATPLGIDPETLRLVAQCLNHYATPGPLVHEGIAKIQLKIKYEHSKYEHRKSKKRGGKVGALYIFQTRKIAAFAAGRLLDRFSLSLFSSSFPVYQTKKPAKKKESCP